ncbi:hypothetical protein GCM10023189_30950 [Nibrella saemangeumensis]|uniref:Glycosyltransferase 2-like domain-containing protein n=1 Tax=Nibrella saemangeumensis TaxID=1084526 RepID=A0ABP8N2P4_9BACT
MSSVCIIVPCFNEASRLPVGTFLAFQQQHPDISFCFVDDGSQDATADVLKQLQARNQAQTEVLILDRNQGKAGAVRAGMLHMTHDSRGAFDYLGYLDADLATPLPAIWDLSAQLDQHPQREMVMGSRIKYLGVDIRRNNFRHYVGRIIATAISNLLKLAVYDTQCGAKLFRRVVVPDLFRATFISPWLFDVEILARQIQRHGRAGLDKYVVEVPLRQWVEQDESRVKLSYFFRMWGELYRIYQAYR